MESSQLTGVQSNYPHKYRRFLYTARTGKKYCWLMNERLMRKWYSLVCQNGPDSASLRRSLRQTTGRRKKLIACVNRKCIELYRIQKSTIYFKNCSLQPWKSSFLAPYLQGLSRLVKWIKLKNSAVSRRIGIRSGMSKHLGEMLTRTKSYPDRLRNVGVLPLSVFTIKLLLCCIS